MNEKSDLETSDATKAFLRLSSAVLLCVLMSNACTVSAEDIFEEVTATGAVSIGTLDSSVVSTNGKSLSFPTNSDIAKKIFMTCRVNDICKVTGTVKSGDYLWLDSVTQVVLVERK